MVALILAKAAIVIACAALAVLAGGRVVTAVFRLAERTRATELGDDEAGPQPVAPLTKAGSNGSPSSPLCWPDSRREWPLR